MTIFYALFNPTTGEITGKISLTDEKLADRYPNKVAISEFMYRSELEKTKRINLASQEIVDKAQVVLARSGETFPADGISIGSISFTGLQGNCGFRLNGELLEITAADPVLEITSNTPKRFRVRVEDLNHWSDEIEIRAV